jgi:hypothetical protein
MTAYLGSSAVGIYVPMLLAIEATLECAAPIVVCTLLPQRLNDETLINCAF